MALHVTRWLALSVTLPVARWVAPALPVALPVVTDWAPIVAQESPHTLGPTDNYPLALTLPHRPMGRRVAQPTALVLMLHVVTN